MSARGFWAAAFCAAWVASGAAPAPRPAIFVVSAHPDDFEGCVGTMFLLRHKYDVHMMNFTAGEAGLGKEGFDSGEAKRLRYREECDACGYVGAKLYYAGEMNAPACYPEKQAYANRATCEKIAALIRKLKPRAVFTHWPIDHHDDHSMTAMAVLKAIEMSGEDPEVFYFEQGPWEVAQFMPRHFVDISSVVKQRETFTRFYRCQGPDELVGEKLALSTWRGQRDLWPRVPHVELLGVRVPRPVGAPSVLDDVPKAMPPVTFIAYPDRRLRVYAGGAAYDFAVEPPPEKTVRDESVTLRSDGAAYTWCLAAIRAQECSVRHALVPGSLKVSDEAGAPLERGVDWRADETWGHLWSVPGGKLGKEGRAKVSYVCRLRRLDAVVKDRDGTVRLVRGTPHAVTPCAPEPAPGEEFLGTVYVAPDEPWGDGSLFPVESKPADGAAVKAPAGVPSAAKTLPRAWKTLNEGGTLRILAWGDSVTECGFLPDEDRWQAQFVRRLGAAFPKAKIELASNGWGGRNSGSFLAEPPGSKRNYLETVVNAPADLVAVEFVNDAGMNRTRTFARYSKILADLKAAGKETILITPHYVRRDWMGLKGRPMKGLAEDPRTYVKALREFAQENGVALADASRRWGTLDREGVPYETLFTNGINHPNAKGMGYFADALMELFAPARRPAGPHGETP